MKCFVKNIAVKLLVLFVTFSSTSYANEITDLINNTSKNENNKYCTESDCFFPEKELSDADIIIDSQISWNSNKNLVLHTRGKIIFKKAGKIIIENNSNITLKSAMEPGNKIEQNETVVFEGLEPQIKINGNGVAKIYHNPTKRTKKHKFKQAYYYEENITPSHKEVSYMLINDIDDLQAISAFPSGNYALSQKIDAFETRRWANGKGFMPIGGKRQKYNKPFSGNFDGNNYVIDQLYINRPEEDNVGIFALSSGRGISNNIISNLRVSRATINGNFHVGTFVSEGVGTTFLNIKVEDSTISGYGSLEGSTISSVGYIAGVLQGGAFFNATKDDKTQVKVNQIVVNNNNPFGACLDCHNLEEC